MKRFSAVFRVFIIFFTIFVGSTGQAQAVNWVIIGGSMTFDVYVDVDSIQRSGNTVESWLMFDYKKPIAYNKTKKLYKSSIALMEYNCPNKSSRYLSETGYSGGLGKGEVIYSYEEQFYANSTRLIPGSVGERICLFVCEYTAAVPSQKP